MSASQTQRSYVSGFYTFSGRASRSEYWWGVLPLILAIFAAVAFDLVVIGPEYLVEHETRISARTGEVTETVRDVVRYSPREATAIVSILCCFPFAAHLSRRVQDLTYPRMNAFVAIFLAFFAYPLFAMTTGASSLFGAVSIGIAGVVLAIVSMIALVVIVLWGFSPSDPEQNEYGPNPHEVTP